MLAVIYNKKSELMLMRRATALVYKLISLIYKNRQT